MVNIVNKDIEFKTLEELYKRLKPALYSKKIELKRRGKDYIKEEDIWNYLLENTWNTKKNLSLAEMTSDILNLEDNLITSYVMNILKTTQREVQMKDDDLL